MGIQAGIKREVIKVNIKAFFHDKSFNFHDVEIMSTQASEVCLYSDKIGFQVGDILKLQISFQQVFKVINLSGIVYLEESSDGAHIGLKFLFADDNDRKDIERFIRQYGIPILKYKRKSPRIPSKSFVDVVPDLKILAYTALGDKKTGFSFLVGDVSLGGVMLAGVGEQCMKIGLGAVLDCRLQSRDICFQGRVQRLTTFKNVNGTVIRKFGLRFVEFDENSKKLFIDMVQKIAANLVS